MADCSEMSRGFLFVQSNAACRTLFVELKTTQLERCGFDINALAALLSNSSKVISPADFFTGLREFSGNVKEFNRYFLSASEHERCPASCWHLTGGISRRSAWELFGHSGSCHKQGMHHGIRNHPARRIRYQVVHHPMKPPDRRQPCRVRHQTMMAFR